MEVSYSSTRSDQWRCNLYVMFHRPQMVVSLLVVPIYFTILLAFTWGKAGWWGILSAFAVSFGGWALLNWLVLWAQVKRRLPTPTTQRICTTLITAEFFRDTVPERVMQYAWSQITEIRLHQGDFYFWVGATKGNFIPRGAFSDPREGQAFFDTAVAYWQSAKFGQPTPAPQEGEVWPPPPRLG